MQSERHQERASASSHSPASFSSSPETAHSSPSSSSSAQVEKQLQYHQQQLQQKTLHTPSSTSSSRQYPLTPHNRADTRYASGSPSPGPSSPSELRRQRSTVHYAVTADISTPQSASTTLLTPPRSDPSSAPRQLAGILKHHPRQQQQSFDTSLSLEDNSNTNGEGKVKGYSQTGLMSPLVPTSPSNRTDTGRTKLDDTDKLSSSENVWTAAAAAAAPPPPQQSQPHVKRHQRSSSSQSHSHSQPHLYPHHPHTKSPSVAIFNGVKVGGGVDGYGGRDEMAFVHRYAALQTFQHQAAQLEALQRRQLETAAGLGLLGVPGLSSLNPIGAGGVGLGLAGLNIGALGFGLGAGAANLGYPLGSSGQGQGESDPNAGWKSPDNSGWTSHNNTAPVHTRPRPDPLANPHNTSNVYINNLPANYTETHLFDMCSEFGPIVSVRMMARESGTCYGFVLFEKVESALECITYLRQFSDVHPSFARTQKLSRTTTHPIPDTATATANANANGQTQSAAPAPAFLSTSLKPPSGPHKSGTGDVRITQGRLVIPTSNSAAAASTSLPAQQELSPITLEAVVNGPTLFIDGLPNNIDLPTLAALFAPHQIGSARFFQPTSSDGVPGGYVVAFVKVANLAAAAEVIDKLNGRKVNGWEAVGGGRMCVRISEGDGQDSVVTNVQAGPGQTGRHHAAPYSDPNAAWTVPLRTQNVSSSILHAPIPITTPPIQQLETHAKNASNGNTGRTQQNPDYAVHNPNLESYSAYAERSLNAEHAPARTTPLPTAPQYHVPNNTPARGGPHSQFVVQLPAPYPHQSQLQHSLSASAPSFHQAQQQQNQQNQNQTLNGQANGTSNSFHLQSIFKAAPRSAPLSIRPPPPPNHLSSTVSQNNVVEYQDAEMSPTSSLSQGTNTPGTTGGPFTPYLSSAPFPTNYDDAKAVFDGGENREIGVRFNE